MTKTMPEAILPTLPTQYFGDRATESDYQATFDTVHSATHSTGYTSGPPSSWITRVCQYPRPEKFLARPGLEPGSPAFMASALPTELLTTASEMSACPFN